MPKIERKADTVKIGSRVVAAAAKKSQPYFIWDVEIKGFGVVVRPSGVKSYVYRYRTARSRRGRKKLITIGRADDWSASEAREEAERLRAEVRAGRDPQRDRRGVGTVSELLDAYLNSESFGQLAPSTQSIDRGRIERHLKPTLGRELVDKLTHDDVARAHRKICDGKTAGTFKTKPRGLARVKGGDGAARMAIDLLKRAFNWAVQEKFITDNPAKWLKTGGSGERDTVIEDAAGYARLFQTLDNMESEKRIPAAAADAIRVIALTGARRGEIADLRWEHVNLDRGAIILPPNQHKTGRRTKKPRVIDLPAAAQAIIARQAAGEPSAFVFARRNGSLASTLTHYWRRRCRPRNRGKRVLVERSEPVILERGVAIEADLPKGITLHGLRHSHGSHMAMSGLSTAAIKTALGHTQLSTVQRYIHWADKQRKDLAEHAAAVALAGLAEASGATVGEIVALPKRRPT